MMEFQNKEFELKFFLDKMVGKTRRMVLLLNNNNP